MIMIILNLIIPVAEVGAPARCPLLFSLPANMPAFFQRGGQFATVNSIQGDTFSGRLNILWSECNE